MKHVDGIYLMKFNKFRASNRLVTRNNYIVIESKMFGILNFAVCVRDEFIVVQAAMPGLRLPMKIPRHETIEGKYPWSKWTIYYPDRVTIH